MAQVQFGLGIHLLRGPQSKENLIFKCDWMHYFWYRKSQFMYRKALACSLLFITVFSLMAYELPKGWRMGGTRPDMYDMGIDEGAGQDGRNAATIRSYKKEVPGYGLLVQSFNAEKYHGKRLKMSAYIKTKNVTEWAGLLMKVEGNVTNPVYHTQRPCILSFDNMYNRLISGTTDYTKYDIVLDVPDTATVITYGARLNGGGQIWFDGIRFDVVGNDVPVTTPALQEPTNYDFDK
jgi:hypothetical protein